ncbi:MAG: tetratricopeptide repeat protein [Bradyrhizobium sp.]|nr:tetratricopeptide repeat protein [Bradyrhizobium sp.]
MVLKSSLLAGLALTIVALTVPLRLFDSNVGACKGTTNATRIETCSAAINASGWHYDNLAWAYANRGDAYRLKGQTDLAIADYDQAIRLEPHRSITHHNRALAYQAKGDFDRAIADYSQAISRWHLRTNTSKAEYLSHRADAYKQKGDLALSKADYDAAIRLSSHDSDLYYNRGLLFKAMNEPDRAIADYTRAIAEFDASETALTEKRDYLTERAEVYKAKGETKLASADFDQATAIDATISRAAGARTRLASVVKR